MRRYLTSIILLLLSWITFSLYADTCYSVSDDSGHPVAGATVTASDTIADRVIEVCLTDEQGSACLQETMGKDVLVNISAPRYKKVVFVYDPAKTTVVLEQDATDLQEVTVYAIRDNVKQSGGTLVFTPGSLKKEVSNIYDLIKYVPMVNHEDGKFKILGRNTQPIIKINGKLPRELGAGFMAALQSLPATMVRRVEVTPNAGSTEASSSTGGVINLVIDMPDEGILNRANAGLSYSTDFSTNESYWIGWKRKRFSGSATFGFSNDAQHNEMRERYEYPDIGKDVEQTRFIKSSRQDIQGAVSMAYTLSQKAVVGFGTGIQSRHEWDSSYTEGEIRMDGESTRTCFLNRNRLPWHFPSYGVSAWSTLYPNPQKNMLDIFAGYSHNVRNSYNTYEESGMDGGKAGTRQDLGLKSQGYSLKATFMQVLSGAHRIAGGYDFYAMDINQDQDYADTDPDRFHYKEMNNAIYGEWSATWSSLFSTRVGLRGEYLHTRGHQTQEGTTFSHDYWNLFPSVSLSFNIPAGGQSLSLSVARTEDLPIYSLLNPYKRWYSETSYYTGNPDLKPSYSWTTDFTYSFLSSFMAGASWNHQPGMRENYTYVKDGYTVSSSTNLGDYDALYCYLQYFKSFWERLRVNVTAGVWHISRNGEIEGSYLRDVTTYFSGNIRVNYLISEPYQWRASAMFIYNSRESGLTSYGLPFYNLSVELSKDWKCGLSVKAACSHIVTNRDPFTFSNDVYRRYSLTVHRPVTCSLNLSYTFGNLRVQRTAERQMTIK